MHPPARLSSLRHAQDIAHLADAACFCSSFWRIASCSSSCLAMAASCSCSPSSSSRTWNHHRTIAPSPHHRTIAPSGLPVSPQHKHLKAIALARRAAALPLLGPRPALALPLLARPHATLPLSLLRCAPTAASTRRATLALLLCPAGVVFGIPCCLLLRVGDTDDLIEVVAMHPAKS